MKNIFIQTNKGALLLALLAVNVSQVSASTNNPFSLKAMLRMVVVGAFTFNSGARAEVFYTPDGGSVNCCDIANKNLAQGIRCFMRDDYTNTDAYVFNPNSPEDTIEKERLAMKEMGCCQGPFASKDYYDSNPNGFCNEQKHRVVIEI